MSSLALRRRLEQGREAPRRSLRRVRSRSVLIAQTAAAAGISWELATLVQPRPYFAPIASVIALSASAGQHLRRAVELSFGVAVGILVADLLLSLVGTSGVMVAVIVAAAMTTAMLFGGGQILVNQAAVSAVLLATLGTQGSSSFTRFFSALIGCGVAVLVGPVLLRRDPLRGVAADAERVLESLAGALEEIAGALAAGDQASAARALETARAADGDIESYEDSVAAARESLRLTPPRRRDLPRLAIYADALQQVDLAIRNTGVLARGVQTAAVRGVPSEPELPDAVRLLADAVRALGADLGEPHEDSEARRLARQAAADATAALDRRQDLASNLIVAQIRSTAADILRGSGMDTRELRAVLGPLPGVEPPARDG